MAADEWVEHSYATVKASCLYHLANRLYLRKKQELRLGLSIPHPTTPTYPPKRLTDRRQFNLFIVFYYHEVLGFIARDGIRTREYRSVDGFYPQSDCGKVGRSLTLAFILCTKYSTYFVVCQVFFRLYFSQTREEVLNHCAKKKGGDFKMKLKKMNRKLRTNKGELLVTNYTN